MISRQTSSIAWMLRQASISGLGRGLDDVEMDAVGEGLAAAEHQHPGVLGDGGAQRGGQPLALAGRHGAVVEREAQHPDRADAPVADLPVVRGRHRHVREPVVQRHGGRQLQRLPARPADVADPEGRVAGADEHRPVAAAQDVARPAGERRTGVGVEHRDRRSGQRGAHTRRTVGGPDPPEDRRGGVGPGELPVRLAHRRPQPAAHVGAVVERCGDERRVGRLDQDLVDELDRRVGHRPGVEAALAGRLGRVDRERAAGPDRSGVHLLDGLQRGDTPLALTVEDRPVQRGRSPVTGRPGMDDDRAVGPPDPGRHPLAQERADDQIRLMVGDRGAHRLRPRRPAGPGPDDRRPAARPRPAGSGR